MFNPLVSVIIPFYNRFDLLDTSLNSVAQQSFTDYEVILVDDNSDEKIDLRNYIDIFWDKLIFHRLGENSGPGYARSEGRKLAKGKYVAYLDSDDEWEVDFLSKTVEVLETSKASMVFCNTKIKSKNTFRIRNNMESGYKNFFDLITNKKTYWATGSALWRSDISLSKNWKEFRDHEDYLHDILSLKESPKIYYIDEQLCVVNKNDNLGVERSNIDMLKVLIKISEVLPKKKNNECDLVDFIMYRLKKRKYKLSEFRYFFLVFKILLMKGYYASSINVFKIFYKKIDK